MKQIYEFDAIILQNGNMDAAYVEVPYDIRNLTSSGYEKIYVFIRNAEQLGIDLSTVIVMARESWSVRYSGEG